MEAKLALVTGASEGIGREFATKLALQGYKVTVVARNEERLRSLLGTLAGEGHKILKADLATDTGVSTVAVELAQNRYTLLINNAGFGAYGRFSRSNEAKTLEMIQVNCVALTRLMRSYLETASEGCAILNVASIGSFVPLPKNAAYAATKAYVASLTLGAWHEEKDRGVFVCALCPGYTRTEFHKRASPEGAQKVPSAYGMSSEAVVDFALAGLKARKNPILVPGLLNKVVADVLPRVLPRTALTNLVASATAEYYSST